MRFIRGYTLVYLLSLVDTSLDGLHIYLALVNDTIIRVGWRGRFYSHIFTPAFWRGWHLTIGFLNIYRVYSKHLGLLEKTWELHSFLEGTPFNCLCLALSRGGSKVVGNFISSFLRELSCLSRPISSGFSALVYGSTIIWMLIWQLVP